MLLDRIVRMLQSCDGAASLFPPTELYNEKWLLRIFIDWFSRHRAEHHPLSSPPGVRWFSEALLPSAFLPRFQKDPLGESWTHADGAVGHCVIGAEGKADLSLAPDATHFVVLEAKLFSALSPGVRNARYFDQAARSVACIAEVLKRAKLPPDALPTLGFYVLAPQEQIAKGVFDEQMSCDSIQTKVERRVAAYDGDRDQWSVRWFYPTLQEIEIRNVSWEKLLGDVTDHDLDSAQEIEQFYKRCLEFNSPQ